MTLAFKYALFAILATLTNIGTQYLSLFLYEKELSLYIAMAWGTLAGLLVKYIFDKKYIFYYRVQTMKEDSRKFILYSFMGVFTTLIFWGSELAFHFLYRGELSKYIGAVFGLTVGYMTKYQLDKRFVFTKAQSS